MTQLTKEQRYTISVMHKQGFQQKEIAETINKDKSVVSRELERNRNKHGTYSYSHAQMLADVRKERLRKPRTFTGEMKNRINRYMRQHQWSPEQISATASSRATTWFPLKEFTNTSEKTKRAVETYTRTAVIS